MGEIDSSYLESPVQQYKAHLSFSQTLPTIPYSRTRPTAVHLTLTTTLPQP
jgi:hypothetical protein